MPKKKNEIEIPEDEEKKVIRAGKIYAVISYLSFLCFIPLLMKKKNHFAAFHAKQGLCLFLTWLVLLVISVIPFFGHIIGFIGNVVVIILAIQGIIHALNGEYWEMPFFGEKAKELNI